MFGTDFAKRKLLYLVTKEMFHQIQIRNEDQDSQRFPQAARDTTSNYVDDFLNCQDIVEDTVQLTKGIQFIHAQNGFRIRNWLSHSSVVMETSSEQFHFLVIQSPSAIAKKNTHKKRWACNKLYFVRYDELGRCDIRRCAGKCANGSHVCRAYQMFEFPVAVLSLQES